MKTRSLTEGAMLGAITVLLTIVGEYIGIPALIIPVPLMLLVHRQGYRLGILTAVVAALVSSLVAGHVFAGLSIIIWGFVGVSVGMALQEKFTFPKLMVVGIFSNLVVMALNFLLYSLIFGGNVLTEMLTMVTQSIQQAMDMSLSLGVTGEALGRYEQLLEFVPFLFKWGLPALLVVYSVAMTFLNLAVVRIILKRLGDSMAWVSPFVEWSIPPFYALFLLFGMIVTVMGQVQVLPAWLQLLGINSFILFFHTYIVMGLSIVWHFFQRKKVPTILRFLFVFLLLSVQGLAFIVMFLAMTDGVFDFRRLKASKEELIIERDQDEK